MKKLLVLTSIYLSILSLSYAQNVGVGTSNPSALFHVKGISSGSNFITPPTMLVEDSGNTILRIAGQAGSFGDKTGILISDKPYESMIHFFGPKQQLNLGVLGRNQLVVNNNGILVHDRINNPPLDNSAALQVTSFERGVLFPNLSFSERNAIVDPAKSLLLYQVDNDSGFNYNTATASSPSWKKLLTDADLTPITIKPLEKRVGINTSIPTAMLHIRNTNVGERHLVMQDIFRTTEASLQFSNRHLIFQTTENDGSFWDFNDNNGNNMIRLNSSGDIDMSGDLTLGPLRKLGVNTDLPSAPLHVVKTSIVGGPFNSRSLMILEDTDHGYLQFSNPNNKEAGLLSGNTSTPIRSALIFGLDSSVAIRTGGNTTRAFVTKTGNMGIGTAAPAARLDVNGTVKLGAVGTVLANVIKATVNIDLPAIGAGITSTLDFTVPNATSTATVMISPAANFTDGLVIASARVSAASTVSVKFTNTSGGIINMPAMDFYVTLIQ